ncbi:MAG: NAD(P)-dependent oxidoreductase [Rhodospirillales bacterium]|nr:NAD(P)-dependent oxidoreductase [Rhodospirillales bacterium]
MVELTEATVGVAGCGAMGLPMARALARAGFTVKGFDVRPVEEFADFQQHMMASPDDFSENVDIVISVVRDQRQTLDLFFDEQAIFNNPDYPKVCLLASTVSPLFITEVAARLPANVQFFEIPMSGAPIAAEEERLSFMIGADEETAAPFRPLLEAMGRDLHFLGGLTKGMACKVLNNFVAASSVVAVRQVLSEARKLQVTPDQLLAVMKSSSGGTWFGNNFDVISWANEDYDVSNTIGIIEKDVNSLLDALEGAKSDQQATAYIKTIRDRLSALPSSPKKS